MLYQLPHVLNKESSLRLEQHCFFLLVNETFGVKIVCQIRRDVGGRKALKGIESIPFTELSMFYQQS